jgi:dsDNA-binding SOS-regulon protein
MAVIVKYVVVRDGKEDMMFSSKKEADAYDKMLDIAERLYDFLQASALGIDDDQLDALTFFMAQHHNQLGKLLKGGKLEPPASGLTAEPTPDRKAAKAEVSVDGNRKVTKRTRPSKPKAVA